MHRTSTNRAFFVLQVGCELDLNLEISEPVHDSHVSSTDGLAQSTPHRSRTSHASLNVAHAKMGTVDVAELVIHSCMLYTWTPSDYLV